MYTVRSKTGRVLHRCATRSEAEGFVRGQRTAHSPEGTDRSTHPTVVEYAVQDLFKGKSLAAAANRAAKKFSGGENMFFGSGVTLIDPRALEAALWNRLAEHAAKSISKYPSNAEGWLNGTLQHFGQTPFGGQSKPALVTKLKALVIEKLGYNPFSSKSPRFSRMGEQDRPEYYSEKHLREARDFANKRSEQAARGIVSNREAAKAHLDAATLHERAAQEYKSMGPHMAAVVRQYLSDAAEHRMAASTHAGATQ
jgi:hypothetical protein